MLKVPQSALMQDPEFVLRFAHEIRSLVKLSHKHIVQIFAVGEHEGTPFAAMQYLPGGNLRDRKRIDETGKAVPTSPAELAQWLPAVAAALDFIHKKGYVHRDVKPDNVLFDAEGEAYLGDFGIAKALADDRPGGRQTALTGTGAMIGTPRYMAPEQILGEPCDGRADQYGLAVTVYEVLSGQAPFDGPTPTAIFQLQAKGPASLSTHLPGIPASLETAVQKALSREPSDRFTNCSAFAQEVLRAAGASNEAGARGDGEPGRAKRPGTAHTGQPTSAQRVAVACPGCKKKFWLPVRAQGQEVVCPSCGRDFRAPSISTLSRRRNDQALRDTGQAQQSQAYTERATSPPGGTHSGDSQRVGRKAPRPRPDDSRRPDGHWWTYVGVASAATALLCLLAWLILRDTSERGDTGRATSNVLATATRANIQGDQGELARQREEQARKELERQKAEEIRKELERKAEEARRELERQRREEERRTAARISEIPRDALRKVDDHGQDIVDGAFPNRIGAAPYRSARLREAEERDGGYRATVIVSYTNIVNDANSMEVIVTYDARGYFKSWRIGKCTDRWASPVTRIDVTP